MKMQAFYKRLFLVKASRKYQRQLAGLTQFSRDQIVEAAGELTWNIWSAGTSAEVPA